MTSKKAASSVLIHHVKLRKRGRKKKLLRSIIDYLKSNVYMFAPLVSSQNSGFCSTVSASAPCSGEFPPFFNLGIGLGIGNFIFECVGFPISGLLFYGIML